MKKEIDAKQINQKINEAPPKHRAFCSNDMPGIGSECENCDENFTSRKTLEQHLEDHHTKKRKLTGKVCHACKKTFELNVDIEIHMKTHQNPKMFKCKLCDKTFHLKWRLTKHVTGHDTQIRFCHSYNKGVECPVEENGCMFSHSVSPQCWFKSSCRNQLCPYMDVHSCITRSNMIYLNM